MLDEAGAQPPEFFAAEILAQLPRFGVFHSTRAASLYFTSAEYFNTDAAGLTLGVRQAN